MSNTVKLQRIIALVSSSALLTFSLLSLETVAQTQGSFEIAQTTSSWLRCTVKGLKQGQLAVRNEPNGPAIVGLNNGNTVLALMGTGKNVITDNGVSWNMVKVIKGPNSRVNNREGWVNSSYLDCEPPKE